MAKNSLLNIYRSVYADKANRLTVPLKTYFGIDVFGYSILKPDGSYFQITNVPEESEVYFGDNLFLHNPMTRDPHLYKSCHNMLDSRRFESIDPGQYEMNQKYGYKAFYCNLVKVGCEAHLFIFSVTNPSRCLQYFIRKSQCA